MDENQVSAIFNGLTIVNFQTRINDDQTVLKIFETLGLVPRKPSGSPGDPSCPRCSSPLVSETRTDSVLGWRFRCSLRSCRKVVAAAQNTWLSRAHLSPFNVLLLSFFFVSDIAFKIILEHTGLAKQTITDWYRFMMEVCDKMVDTQTTQIGGYGCTVQLDETYLYKKKYNRGRELASRWYVFGGVCMETGEYFMQRVARCNKETLWPIMRRRITPGSTVYTDGARVYEGIDGEEGNNYGFHFYDHKSVIHNQGEFVRDNSDDEDAPRISTNLVENLWRHLKRSIKCQDTEEDVDLYSARFCYFRTLMRDTPPGLRLLRFLNHIKEVYPGVSIG